MSNKLSSTKESVQIQKLLPSESRAQLPLIHPYPLNGGDVTPQMWFDLKCIWVHRDAFGVHPKPECIPSPPKCILVCPHIQLQIQIVVERGCWMQVDATFPAVAMPRGGGVINAVLIFIAIVIRSQIQIRLVSQIK